MSSVIKSYQSSPVLGGSMVPQTLLCSDGLMAGSSVGGSCGYHKVLRTKPQSQRKRIQTQSSLQMGADRRQSGKHHRAPQCAQPRQAGVPQAGGRGVISAGYRPGPDYSTPRPARESPARESPELPRFQVRILQSPLFSFFWGPSPVGSAVGCLSEQRTKPHKTRQAGCEFPAQVSGLSLW